MYPDDFEKAFSDFWNAENMIRRPMPCFLWSVLPFIAGWKAAGGEPPPPQKVIELVRLDLSEATEDDIETDLCVLTEQERG